MPNSRPEVILQHASFELDEEPGVQVTVSSKYQVVIPKKIRESLGIRPDQKIEVIEHRGLIELVPVRPIIEMRGILPGIDTDRA